MNTFKFLEMKKSKYLLVFVVFFSLSQKEAKAQIDTLFWFAAPWVTPDHWWRDPIAFHFSTFNNPTAVRIQQPVTGYDTTINIPANSLFSKYVDFMINAVESKPANTVLNTGFKITSDFPITVVYDVITRPTQHYNPETFSLKGQNGLGKEFVCSFQTRWNNQTLSGDLNGDSQVTQPYQQINIVATEPNTTVYITPRCNVVGGHPANVTYSVVLPLAGNTYTVQNLVQNTSVPGNNLAGTIVVADKPIAVTVTDDSVNPSGGGGCYDLMGDQTVPVDVVGTDYIVLKGNLNVGSEESFFITATENFTQVTINDGFNPVTNVLLNQGDTYRYLINNAGQPRTYVQADKPVYVLHMTGYGCELGEAILPPLNCAGSQTVTFPRTNAQNFSLNILCPTGAEGAFLLNGNPALVPAAAFNPVPGTGGQWLAAQITFTTAQIPAGSSNILTNSIDNFGMGVINGGTTTGCLYHYMSSFIRRVYTHAGNDTILCSGDPFVPLNGSVTGGATTGIWTTINGSGTFNNPTDLVGQYNPTASDYSQGTVTFVLESTGNCLPVRDTLVVQFIQSPIVTAGVDNVYCKNNVPQIPLNGTLQYAVGSNWSGGAGGSFGNAGSLNTFYTPSPADLANDSVAIVITSAGSFFACPDDSDTVVFYFTEPPVVVAGPNQTICTSVTDINLNGFVGGTSNTGVWSYTGTGSISPSNNSLTGIYSVTPTDTTASQLWFYLTSTNNGNCLAVVDSFQVNILSKPSISMTVPDSVCSNLSSINLSGNVTSGFDYYWSTDGAGTIVSPNNTPNTSYTISPIDVSNGFVNIALSTTPDICPTESDTVTVYFIAPPTVFAGNDINLCSNEAIQLNGNISGPNPQGTWTSTGTGVFNPGNNFISTIYIPSALDISNGNVQLTLTSTNNFGCPPTNDALNVTFLPIPNASFNATTVCEGNNTTFTDQSTVSSGSITSWNWDFGGFGSSVAQNPLYTFPASGPINVTLIVQSSNGCYDTIQQTVVVNPNPVVSFTPTRFCVGLPTEFIDNSFIPTGSIVSWSYDFGDGSPVSNLQNPIHIYTSSGTYNVVMTATSNLGCTGTSTTTVTALPGPNAAFTASPNPALINENIQFTDQSTGNIAAWLWNFGNNTGSNSPNPVHSYPDGGSYIVYLVVTDNDGCVDTARTVIDITLLPVLPTAFTPNGDGENDSFIIRGGPFKSVDFRIYNNWGEQIFFSDDASIGWDGTYKGNPAQMGVYTWKFIVELPGGRIITQSGDVTLIR
jgi:gliding motility-associated-like protein